MTTRIQVELEAKLERRELENTAAGHAALIFRLMRSDPGCGSLESSGIYLVLPAIEWTFL